MLHWSVSAFNNVTRLITSRAVRIAQIRQDEVVPARPQVLLTSSGIEQNLVSDAHIAREMGVCNRPRSSTVNLYGDFKCVTASACNVSHDSAGSTKQPLFPPLGGCLDQGFGVLRRCHEVVHRHVLLRAVRVIVSDSDDNRRKPCVIEDICVASTATINK